MTNATIYLHIGIPKTGTTTLQNRLATNRDALMEQGILYPETGIVWGAHHELVDHDFVTVVGAQKRSRAEVWQVLLDEIARASCSKVVLSSELFWARRDLIDPAAVRELLGDFDVRVVVYLRRQDHWLESAYAEWVQSYSSRETEPIQKYLQGNESVRLDYSVKLRQWASAFGAENIVVRPYEKEQLKSGLWSDFLTVIGADPGRSYAELEQLGAEHKTMQQSFIEVMRLCNPLGLAADEQIGLMEDLREVSVRLDESEYFAARSQLSGQEKVNLLEACEPSNAWIANEFLGRADGRLFLEPRPDPAQYGAPFDGLQMEEAVRIMGGLHVVQNRKADELIQAREGLEAEYRNLQAENRELREHVRLLVKADFGKQIETVASEIGAVAGEVRRVEAVFEADRARRLSSRIKRVIRRIIEGYRRRFGTTVRAKTEDESENASS